MRNYRSDLLLAVDGLEAGLGVTGHADLERGRIVVSESDAATLRGLAVFPVELYGHRDQVFGIPLVTAPDWTCDPASVAWCRFVARLWVALRLRRLTAWLVRVPS